MHEQILCMETKTNMDNSSHLPMSLPNFASSIFQQSVHEFDKSQIPRSNNPKSNRYLSTSFYDPVKKYEFLLFLK
jgi:hypothetical protein